MKKAAVILFTISLLIMISLLMTSFQKSTENKFDYVPDKMTAIKVAEAIWLPIYGERIMNKKPFTAKLNNDDVWEVTGTLKSQKGGVPYIEIRKKDCKILKVSHGK